MANESNDLQTTQAFMVIIDTACSRPMGSYRAVMAYIRSVEAYVKGAIMKENVRVCYRFANGQMESSVFRLHIPFFVNGRTGTIGVDVLAPKPGRNTPILAGIDVCAMLGVSIDFPSHSFTSEFLGLSRVRLNRNRMGHYEFPLLFKPEKRQSHQVCCFSDCLSDFMFDVFQTSPLDRVDQQSLKYMHDLASRIQAERWFTRS